MNLDRAELAVAGLLLLVAVAAVGFVVTYVAGADTQALGLTAGLAFASLAAACVIAGTRVVRSEQRSERRADYSHALEPGPETSELKESSPPAPMGSPAAGSSAAPPGSPAWLSAARSSSPPRRSAPMTPS